MKPSVSVPASWLAAGYMMPTVCRRHGTPGTRVAHVRFRSNNPGWTYALLLIPMAFTITNLALRQTVTCRWWPVCDRCARIRVARLLGGAGLMVGAFASLLSIAAVKSDTTRGLLAIALIASLIAGAVILGGANHARVARGVVVDKFFVRFTDPHPAFAHQVATAATTWVPTQHPHFPPNPSPVQYYSPS